MKLKHKFVNFDFKQMLVKLSRRVAYQADHFSSLIGKFKRLEGLNETEYGKLDEKFLNLLQSTRANLIKISPNYFCTLCEISKSLNELDHMRYKDKNTKVILKIKHIRAQIYRAQGYHYLEERELLAILEKQSMRSGYNPIVYQRLSSFSMLRGDRQSDINYINFANKKYCKRSKKKIYRKVGALRSWLVELDQHKNAINLPLEADRWRRMSLFQIANLIDKVPALKLKTRSLLNCLLFPNLI